MNIHRMTESHAPQAQFMCEAQFTAKPIHARSAIHGEANSFLDELHLRCMN